MSDEQVERAFAGRAELLRGVRRRFGEVVLPACGERVRFQSLTEGEQSEYEFATWRRDDDGKLVRDDEAVRRASSRLICLCLVDGEGKRLFSDADLDLIDDFDALDSGCLWDALCEHCGINRRTEAQKKTA